MCIYAKKPVKWKIMISKMALLMASTCYHFQYCLLFIFFLQSHIKANMNEFAENIFWFSPGSHSQQILFCWYFSFTQYDEIIPNGNWSYSYHISKFKFHVKMYYCVDRGRSKKRSEVREHVEMGKKISNRFSAVSQSEISDLASFFTLH